MVDADYFAKMFPPPTAHKPDCGWHLDQYWHECDCGAIPVAELKVEKTRRGLDAQSNEEKHPC